MLLSVDSIFKPVGPDMSEDALLRMRCDSQSMCYYGDISRFISERILGNETLSILDVGPRTGSGLALLRLLHNPWAFTRLKFDPVCGIDLDPSFERIASVEFPDIKPMTGDIFDLEPNSFDLVLCSHTIEHIDQAEDFVRQLENIARRYVVLACPFEELEPRSDGHIRRIDEDFFKGLGFTDVIVYESYQFHNGPCCLAFKAL